MTTKPVTVHPELMSAELAFIVITTSTTSVSYEKRFWGFNTTSRFRRRGP